MNIINIMYVKNKENEKKLIDYESNVNKKIFTN